MPSIVLTIRFFKFFHKIVLEETLENIKSKFTVEVNPDEVIDMIGERTKQLSQTPDTIKRTWKDRMLHSFIAGKSGNSKVGVFNSFVHNDLDFYICSYRIEDCMNDRKWLLQHLKELFSILKLRWYRIKTDFLYIEGGSEIEKTNLERFSLKYSSPFIVNFVLQLSIGVYNYVINTTQTQLFDIYWHLWNMVLWFFSFIIIRYLCKDVVYVVK